MGLDREHLHWYTHLVHQCKKSRYTAYNLTLGYLCPIQCRAAPERIRDNRILVYAGLNYNPIDVVCPQLIPASLFAKGNLPVRCRSSHLFQQHVFLLRSQCYLHQCKPVLCPHLTTQSLTDRLYLDATKQLSAPDIHLRLKGQLEINKYYPYNPESN